MTDKQTTRYPRYPARWNGQETYATRMSGRWFVGGDVAPGDEDILILLEKNGAPAWFKLRGNRLVFDDMEG